MASPIDARGCMLGAETLSSYPSEEGGDMTRFYSEIGTLRHNIKRWEVELGQLGREPADIARASYLRGLIRRRNTRLKMLEEKLLGADTNSGTS